MKKVKKSTIKELDTLRRKIHTQKSVIARERDTLRALVWDVECIVDSMDEGLEVLDYAVDNMKSAIESLSEYV